MNFYRIHKLIVPCIITGGILICSLNVSANVQYFKHGVQSEEVKQIQTELKKLGYFDGQITGYYGDVTKNAVIGYQRTNGFSADGVVGPDTWKVLVGADLTSPVAIDIPSTQDLVLKVGSSGEQVKRLQLKLKEIGYFKGSATGYYGQVTADFVKKYQSDDGAVADGIVCQGTWNSLFGFGTLLNESTESIDVISPIEVKLKKGDCSDDVKKAQEKLKELGYFSANSTGLYGNITLTSVKNFQYANGLEVDGIIGKTTWDKLFSDNNIAVSEILNSTERNSISRGGNRESSAGQGIVAYAKEFVGVRYVWGGNTQNGFDCSGYVKYVYKNFGIELNRVAADQANQGTKISKANLLPGDLVFFDTDGGSNYINHVGIYIGDGSFIQSSSGAGKVLISNLNEGFYANSYMTARRLL